MLGQAGVTMNPSTAEMFQAVVDRSVEKTEKQTSVETTNLTQTFYFQTHVLLVSYEQHKNIKDNEAISLRKQGRHRDTQKPCPVSACADPVRETINY